MRWLFAIPMLLGAVLSAPAGATWLQARTDHFVLVIDGDEAEAREYATRIERFDAALRKLYGIPDNPDRKANPVHLFALRTSQLQAACGCPNLAGLYRPHAGGSVIFTTYAPGRIDKAKPGAMDPQEVLLHEYGHHFMYSSYALAYPRWYSEGFAEFNSNVTFNPDGSITIGLPANYRYNGLFADSNTFTIRDLLDPQSNSNFNKYLWYNPEYTNKLYARGWLLTHYLTLDKKRAGQLSTYLHLMDQGQSSLDAAKSAFGDLDALYRELGAYRDGKMLDAPFRVPPRDGEVAVKIEALSPGAAAMMPVHLRSTLGVKPPDAKRLADDAEHAAAPFASDPLVQTELAEAEYDADDLDATEAAADRALAANGSDVQALLYKARATLTRAVKAKSADPATWSKARGWIIAANRADPNAAEVLILYYRSFGLAGAAPSAGAVKALMRAEVLAPEDDFVRLLLAEHLLETNDIPAARGLLQPLANSPHPRERDEGMRQILDSIDKGDVEEARKALTTQIAPHQL